jgi:hypothetical protein
MGILFPVQTIKGYHGHFCRSLVETAQIDINTIRVRARNIEWLDTTGFTKTMLGDMGIEGVGTEVSLALQQAKLRARYDQVQMTAAGAYRTITVFYVDLCWRVNFKSHRAAVAAALVNHGVLPISSLSVRGPLQTMTD